MARHRSPDDDADDAGVLAAELAVARSAPSGDRDQGLTTGRHHFPGLAELELGPDPLTAHQSKTPATDTGTTDAATARPIDVATARPIDLRGLARRLLRRPPSAARGSAASPDATEHRPRTGQSRGFGPDLELGVGPQLHPSGFMLSPPPAPARGLEAAPKPTLAALASPAAPEVTPARPAPAPTLAAPDVKPALTDAPTSDPDRSRAGRNLPAAIGVGLALGAVILLTLFLYRPSFLVVVILAVAYGTYELRTAIATVEARPPLVPLLIGGAAIALTGWERGTNGIVVSTLLTVAAVVVWRLGDGAAGYLRDVASSLLVLAYLPLLAGFAVLLARPDDGAARIVVFVATVVCSDTGGYAAGVWLGRHPLAPGVSKAKTWEGSAGSLVACCIAGALFLSLVFHESWWKGVAFGAAIMVTATVGDLGESMIKRDLGVKDMGRLLPGHGGLMDRLDSILPCAAVAYLLLSYFAPA